MMVTLKNLLDVVVLLTNTLRSLWLSSAMVAGPVRFWNRVWARHLRHQVGVYRLTRF